MTDALVEEVARGMWDADDTNGAGPSWQEWVEYCQSSPTLSVHPNSPDAYRSRASAALAIARPAIEREVREACAKVAETCSFGVDIGEWLTMTKKEVSARACKEVAAAIRKGEA